MEIPSLRRDVDHDYVYSKLAEASYDFDKPDASDTVFGYKRNKAYDTSNPKSGFQGCVFENNDEVVIAYRGADESGLNTGVKVFTSFFGNSYDPSGDSGSNVAMKKNEIPQQYYDAMKLYENVASNPAYMGKKIRLTGHSLGGSLAQLVASTKGKDGNSPHTEAVTFNAYGRKDFIAKPGDGFEDFGNTYNYTIDGDMVGMGEAHPGTTLSFPLHFNRNEKKAKTSNGTEHSYIEYVPQYDKVANEEEQKERPTSITSFHGISNFTNSSNKVWQATSKRGNDNQVAEANPAESVPPEEPKRGGLLQFFGI